MSNLNRRRVSEVVAEHVRNLEQNCRRTVSADERAAIRRQHEQIAQKVENKRR